MEPTADPGTSLAEAIVAGVGGATNVASVEHCVTRLRFVLRDRALARRDALAALPGVVSVVNRGGQLQVVIGDEVPDVYAAIRGLPAFAATASGDVLRGPRLSLGDRAFQLLTGTFQPLLYALVGSSMIRTFLALAVELGWIDPDGTTHAVWAAAGNAAFTFLPVLVGITASIKLGTNPYLGGAIGAALLDEHFTGIGPIGTESSFLGLPVVVTSYGQAVIPPIMAAVALAWLERRLKRWLPRSLHLIMVPAICLGLLVPATVILFGPVGNQVGIAVSEAIGWAWDLSPAAAGALLGGFWQVFVIFGVHWAFVPVIVNDLTVQGYSLLTGPLVPAVLAQGAAALAVTLRTRDRSFRSLAGAASLTAFVAGVTEPAIYGVTLRLRRPFVYACVGGAIGGAVAAAGGSAADSFILPGLVTLPAYLSVGSFPLQLVGTAAAVAIAFGLTWFVGFTDVPPTQAPPVGGRWTDEATMVTAPAVTAPEGDALDQPAWSDQPGAPAPAVVRLLAPLDGEVVALSSVSDPVFAGGLLGPGLAIRPSEGVVHSPIDGTVTSVARARHAVGVSSPGGVDVLVHVGIDTVHMAGRGFEALVKQGQSVRAGDPMIRVDLEALAAAGYDPTTPVVVTNAAAHRGVEILAEGQVAAGDPLIEVTPGPAGA